MLCIYKTCHAVLYVIAVEVRALGVNVEALWAVVYDCWVWEAELLPSCSQGMDCWNIDPYSVAVGGLCH